MSFLLSVLALLPASEPVTGDIWPGFRGRGDGICYAKSLPLAWSETDNIAWKVVLPGYGQSSPVVSNDKVFVTAVVGREGGKGDKGLILAYHVQSGKDLWRHQFQPSEKVKTSNMASRAAPTPAVDAVAVYAFFEEGDLLALSHEGKKLWQRSIVKDHGKFQIGHGLGSSLAQTDDAVIVLVDHRGPSYLLAIDKKTGKDLWKAERKGRGSWTSPLVVQRGGKAEIIVSSNGSVAGYDAATGKLLWEMDGLTGNTIPSASAAGELILVGAGSGFGGKESKKAGNAKATAKSNCCLKLIDKDGKPSFEVCWTAEKASASYATPLAHRGHAYFVNRVGVVFCIDLATGKERYAERIDGPCWASPIAAGDRVYFFGKDGRTTVLRAGPKFEKLASNSLWKTTASPAVDDGGQPNRSSKNGEGADYGLDPVLYGAAAVEGAIFLRTGDTLYRIGKQ